MLELIYERGIKILTAEKTNNSYDIILITFKVGFEGNSGFVADTFTDFLLAL
ncbi:MAG TPA: hypothetical protein VE076_08350 [Nitrososphaeraceae archaeon]|nr:hypothetical protein [Nitrososphaeraceae archaeon]